MKADRERVLAVRCVTPMHKVDYEVRPGLLVEDTLQGCHVVIGAHPVLPRLLQLPRLFIHFGLPLTSLRIAPGQATDKLRSHKASRVPGNCHSVAGGDQAPVPFRPSVYLEGFGCSKHLQVRLKHIIELLQLSCKEAKIGRQFIGLFRLLLLLLCPLWFDSREEVVNVHAPCAFENVGRVEEFRDVIIFAFFDRGVLSLLLNIGRLRLVIALLAELLTLALFDRRNQYISESHSSLLIEGHLPSHETILGYRILGFGNRRLHQVVLLDACRH